MGSKAKAERRKRGWELQNREYQERRRRLNAQRKAANIRAKYGPTRRPSPVTVKSLETGEVLEVVDQRRWRRRTYSPWLDELARKRGFDGYQSYVESPYWLAIRERVLERDERQCRICGRKSQLSVHHDRYDFVGNERLKFLKTICARCHRRIHR